MLQQLQADYTKLGIRIEELSALVREEQTPNQKAKRLLDAFCSKWAAVKGRKYVPNGAKDIGICKRLVLADLPDVLERMDRFLASKDAFVIRAGHSLPVFAATVNDYGSNGYRRPALDERIATICELAGLRTYDALTWFAGTTCSEDGQTIYVPERDAYLYILGAYGERLAPYAVLKLQEGT